MSEASIISMNRGTSKDSDTYVYKEFEYPVYLKRGNATQYIIPFAKKFCQGEGIDIGGGDNPFPGALNWDKKNGHSAYDVEGEFDYIFSSHCLEHLEDPIKALEIWKKCIKPGGFLFLYLPHPSMEYWLPQNNRKHLHSWYPEDVVKILQDLGFETFHSERDLFWSFAVVGRYY